jgi:ketosteroid isomerase-like protein
MSQENVDVVRKMWEAFLGGNPMSGLAFCDPNIEWDGTNLPDGTVARGREAVVEHVMRWAEQWDDWNSEPERFIDAGGDQVILVFRETGRSEGGLQMDEPHAELYKLRDERVGLPRGLLRPGRGPRRRGAV